MMNFASLASPKPIRRRRFLWGFERALGRRLFPFSQIAVSRPVRTDENRKRSPVPLRCPLPASASLAPEQRLMAAVLDDALLTLARHGDSDPRARKLIAEVDAWIAADDLDWPFSFVNVCSALHLDPSCVRSRVERWRRETLGLASPAPFRKRRRARPSASRR